MRFGFGSLVLRLRVAVVFISACLAFQATRAEPGFFDIRSQDVPREVSANARSVFRVVSVLHRLDLRPTSKSRIESQFVLTSLKLGLPNLESNYGASAVEVKTRRRELEACETKQYCEISTAGSGFLVRDQRTVLTAFHVIRDAIQAELSEDKLWGRDEMTVSERRALVEGLKLKVRLYDHERKLVFGGQATDFVRVLGLADTVLSDASEWSEPAFADDRVQLVLSRDLESSRRPLKVAHSGSLKGELQLKVGEQVYVLGYPGTLPYSLREPNTPINRTADSISLLATRGPTVRQFDLEAVFWTPAQREAAEHSGHVAKRSMVIAHGQFATNSDCASQMSGGPLFNLRGEVVGLLVGNQPGEEHKWSPSRLCVFSAL